MNIVNTLNKAVYDLNQFDIRQANLDSEIILSHVIKKDRKYIILNFKEKLNKEKIKRFNKLINRRKKGEPVAYLINKKEFWNETFYVNKDVLIPRPDTELIIEQVIKSYSKNSRSSVLDIGTGSGCMLLSILKERPNFYGTGIDISKKSIIVSKYNAKMLKLSNRVKLYNSDVDNFNNGKYDIIVSNPPYIKFKSLKYLEKNVVNFEPKLALSGGSDGFSEIRKVISKAAVLIKKNGKLFLEIGFNQKIKVIEILKKEGFYINKALKDYGKNDRCIVCTKI